MSVLTTFVHTATNATAKMIYMYVIWSVLHYLSSNLYVELCTPKTLVGFLTSPFFVPTPHCTALRWISYNGAMVIQNMWYVIGAWCVGQAVSK